MILFNSRGLLTPSTAIPASVEEFRRHFVDTIASATRPAHFQQYLHYSNTLKRVLNDQPLRQWINGSFVTQLANPKDIDVITFIDYRDVATYGAQLDRFRAANAWEHFGVDAYLVEVYPIDHPQHFFYQSDYAYWNDKFGKTRRDEKGKRHAKGYVEIIF